MAAKITAFRSMSSRECAPRYAKQARIPRLSFIPKPAMVFSPITALAITNPRPTTRGRVSSTGSGNTALRKPWRALAFALLAASAAIVAIRAFAGPFHIGPIAINTPLNIEGVFALLWAAAMLLRPGDGTTQPAGTRVGLWWGAFVLAVVIAMFARALWFPLVSDDYILVTQATHPAGSIWRPFVEPGGDGSYRPIGYAILRA